MPVHPLFAYYDQPPDFAAGKNRVVVAIEKFGLLRKTEGLQVVPLTTDCGQNSSPASPFPEGELGRNSSFHCIENLSEHQLIGRFGHFRDHVSCSTCAAPREHPECQRPAAALLSHHALVNQETSPGMLNNHKLWGAKTRRDDTCKSIWVRWRDYALPDFESATVSQELDPLL
jgi:hypothetical protein